MPMEYTANTCVSCINVSIWKVGYMMANTFMHVAITLNYNKVMCIIPEAYSNHIRLQLLSTIVEY